MLFNSLNFIIFFVVVVVVYYTLPKNTHRKVFLLVASYYFYACFNITMSSILLFETIVAYGYGMLNNKSKVCLVTTISFLLLPLLCFKYLDFMMLTVVDAFSLASIVISMPAFEMLLPIGISFYTFMAVGYVVDVYKNKIIPEKNWLDFALFVGFFPQIASGPIGRADQLIPQIKEVFAL